MYRKNKVSYNRNIDRWTYDSNTPRDITDDNIDDRIEKFANVINTSRTNRIPLRYFCDLGKINFPVKTDFKITCNLETDMKKLFESNKKVTAIGSSDTQIIFAKAAFIQYKQFLWKKKFKKYLETILISTKMLRTGVEKTPLQKTYEMQIGSIRFDIDFPGASRQFDWVEISLVYDKSDKHTKIYDSYNVEKAAQNNKSIELENVSET